MEMETWYQMTKRHAEEKHAAIQRCKDAGMGLTETANALDMLPSNFWSWCRGNGVEWPSAAEQSRQRAQKRRERRLSLARSGVSIKWAAQHEGITVRYLKDYSRKHNIAWTQ